MRNAQPPRSADRGETRRRFRSDESVDRITGPRCHRPSLLRPTQVGAGRAAWEQRTKAAAAVAVLLVLAGLAPAVSAGGRELPHKGAFTCDFAITLDPQAMPQQVAGVIEHDRQLMSSAEAARGFRHKVIPFSQGAASGHVLSGGRYLFDTWSQARSYERFVKTEFRTFDPANGQVVPFLQRSGVSQVECHSWRVLGAYEFAQMWVAQHHVRTERWRAPSPEQPLGRLRAQWEDIRDAARLIPGVSAVWLLVNREERLVSLVLFQRRTAPSPGAGLDALMAARSPLQDIAARGGWTPVFTAGQLALSIWLPFAPGDRGAPSLWPNADAVPIVPAAGDGVCAPSRGENAGNEPACLATCGNALADAGETWLNCPADVSPYRD